MDFLSPYLTSNDVDCAGDNDAELVDQLTRDILRVLPSSYLHLPTYAVGIRPRVGRIKELMCFGLDDVQIIGIWGMAGIGKQP